MNDIDNLTMEELKERIDHLEVLVKESEGDPDKTTEYFDELKHVREVYDRMIMDSQGRGIQMMSDLMEKPPETRENYVAGVPVASTDSRDPRGQEDGEHEAAVPAPAPAINLTINVVSKEGGSDMERSFDARTAELTKSEGRFGADIRVPLDVSARLEKGCKSSKGKSTVDAVDLDKMREMRRKMAAGETDEELKGKKKKKKTEDAEKSLNDSDSFSRSQARPLQKGKMANYALHGSMEEAEKCLPHEPTEAQKKMTQWTDSLLERYGTCIKGLDDIIDEIVKKMGVKDMTCEMLDYAKFSRAMAWAIDRLRWRKVPSDKIAKALEITLEKSGTIVGGVKEPTMSVQKAAHARVLAINQAICKVEADIRKTPADDDVMAALHQKLWDLTEQLAIATMGSEGLGLKTEDLIPSQDIKQVDVQPGTFIKSSGHVTGKMGGMKYALSYWDAEGGLSHGKAEKLVTMRIPSTKKAVASRLKSKLPPLPKMRSTEHLVINGGDANAPIRPGGNKGGKCDRTEGGRSRKAHHDRRVGSVDHPGKHKGDMKHYVSGQGGTGGNNQGGVGGGKGKGKK